MLLEQSETAIFANNRTIIRCAALKDLFCKRSYLFVPPGYPLADLEEIILNLDEFKEIRLADHELLYQEDAATRMNVSRQTFGRNIESAHKKIADVLMNGKALKIEGGKVSLEETPLCGHGRKNMGKRHHQ